MINCLSVTKSEPRQVFFIIVLHYIISIIVQDKQYKHLSMTRFLLLSIIYCLFHLSALSQNYDESKVPSYTLPDPLTTLSGKKVTTRTTWQSIRRPEILRLFEDNVYGRM